MDTLMKFVFMVLQCRLLKFKKNYYSGLNKLMAKNIINSREFNQRIGELKNNLTEQ
jgi:hypothetical protein